MEVSPKDQDTSRIVRGIQATQSIRSFTSPSAGLTYCAIGALSFLNPIPEEFLLAPDVARSSGISLEDCTRWILGRQTTCLEEDEAENDEQTSQLSQPEVIPLPSSPLGSPHATRFPDIPLSTRRASSSVRRQSDRAPILNLSEENLRWAGFSGRSNKIADTCYCFWNTGALAVGNPPSFLIMARLIEALDVGPT